MTKRPPSKVQPLHPPGDWLALRARAAEQLIRVTDPKKAAAELFDLIAPDLRLTVLLFYNATQLGRLQLYAHCGVTDEEAAALASWQDGAPGEQPLLGYVPAVLASEDPRTEPLRSAGINAYAAMSLEGGGRMMGIFGFGRRWTDRFSEDEFAFLEAVSGYFAAALERLRNEAARREHEEQMRLAMETAGFGTFDQDLITGERRWSPELKAIYGLSPNDEVTLRMLVGMAHPDDHDSISRAVADAKARHLAGESIRYANDHRIIRTDGQLRWVSVRGQTILGAGEDGKPLPVRFLGVAHDVTEHKLAEERVRLSEERLQLAQELAGVASWDWNSKTDHIWVSDSYYRIFGLLPGSPVTLQEHMENVHPDDREHVLEQTRASFSTMKCFVEFRIIRPSDGEVRWMQSLGGVARDEVSGGMRLVGISLDITDRKRDEERERLLSREVDHRAKNLLNVVQSMVQLTHADTMPAFVEELVGRIHALARVHSLIAASRWLGASLGRLIQEELTPFTADGERVHAEGPAIELKPAAAQSMALIIHELTINALKYGALSQPGGKIEIAWSLNGPGATQLRLSWTETGGPPVRPPTKSGFGTSLIHGSIERHLGGTVNMDWRREGLRCELSLPARQLV